MSVRSREAGGDSGGVVIVVDGPSFVGKTTTITALQRAWPRVRSGPLLDGGYEHALASFGERSIDRWRDLIRSQRGSKASTDEHPHWGPLGRELVAGMHRAAATWARSGFDVVMEHVLLDHTTIADLTASLDGLTVVHIGLTCDPDVLEARELEREGAPRGRAVAELNATADLTDRDLVLDTSESTTAELVDAIVDELDRRLRP